MAENERNVTASTLLILQEGGEFIGSNWLFGIIWIVMVRGIIEVAFIFPSTSFIGCLRASTCCDRALLCLYILWWVKKVNPSTNQLHLAEYTQFHQQVKKFPTFSENQRFITTFRKACELYLEPHLSSLYPYELLGGGFKCHFHLMMVHIFMA